MQSSQQYPQGQPGQPMQPGQPVNPQYSQQPQYPQQPPSHLVPTPGAHGVAFSIDHGPSFAMLRVDLQPGQVFVAEAGAMVARHRQVGMDVKMNAGSSTGLFSGIKGFIVAIIRKVVGGETFFVNHFRSPSPASVWVAPALTGQIHHRRLQPGTKLTLSTGAYLGHVGALDIDMKFGGLRTLLAKEGAFMLEVSGDGDLWFNSYGGIHAVDVNGTYVVDNGHLVGFEGPLTFNIRSAGKGLMGLVASGEGLVCEFKGQGRVYMQSRNLSSLVDWLAKLIR